MILNFVDEVDRNKAPFKNVIQFYLQSSSISLKKARPGTSPVDVRLLLRLRGQDQGKIKSLTTTMQERNVFFYDHHKSNTFLFFTDALV